MIQLWCRETETSECSGHGATIYSEIKTIFFLNLHGQKHDKNFYFYSMRVVDGDLFNKEA
jgi:hypothetical protein